MIARERVRRAALSGHALYRHALSEGPTNVLLRGAAVSFSIGVITRFVSFPVSIVLARSMGAQEFGVYTYVGAWASLLLLVGLLGFDSALKRFVSTYRATEAPQLLGGVLRRANEIVIPLSLLLGVGLIIFALSFHQQLNRSLLLTLIVAGIALPAEAMQKLQVSSLVALKRFASSQILLNLAPAVLIGIGVGVMYLLHREPVRSYEVYALSLLATVGLLVVGGILLRRALPEGVRSTAREYRTREWVRVSVPMLMVDGIRELMNRSDVLLIGLLLGTTPAGIYLIALNLARFTSYGLQATTTAALPLISELYALGKHEELQRMFTVACWAASLVSAAIAMAVLVIREPLLGLFGADFTAGTSVLTILIAGRALDAWTGPNGSLLNMTGHQDIYAVILAVTAVLNATLTYPAVLLWGMEGAAVTTGFSLAAKNLQVWIVVKRQMGMNASIFGPLPLRGLPS